jgi:hypothetical protein
MPRRRSRISLPLAALAVALATPAAASATEPQFTASEARETLQVARDALADDATLAEAALATPAMRDLALALPALDGAAERRARRVLARPDDKGDDEYFGKEAAGSPICNAQFCVHFSEDPKSAPESDEFLAEVVAALDASFAVENTQLGWRAPKGDGDRGARNGVGGEGQVDVYIDKLGRGLYGYAAPDPGQGRAARRHAYLVLDNNYFGFPTAPLDSMRVTVAHEYNHILQFGYDTLGDLWFLEATATWMEEQVYPDIDDYLNFVPSFASAPEAPLTGRKKIYGGSVFDHWLDSRYGPDVIREAWERSTSVEPKHDAVAAIEAAIEVNGGKSFSRDFAAFAVETAEWNSSDDFPDAARYQQVRRSGKLGRKPTEIELDSTAYRLVDVRGGGSSVKLRVDAPRGVRSAIALIGREGPTRSGRVTVRSRYLAKGGTATVTLQGAGGFDRVTAAIVNADGRGAGRNKPGDDARYEATLR